MACTGKCVGLRNLFLPSYVDVTSTKISPQHHTPRRAFMKDPKDNMRLVAVVKRNWGQIVCAAGPESTTSTSTLNGSKPETEPKVDGIAVKPANAKVDTTNVEKAPTEVNASASATSAKPTPPKPKAAAAKKAPAKPLPEMMAEDVIPAVQAILENEKNVFDIELSFQDNKLEGSFTKEDIPYSFWVFFLDGTLEGSKAFSLSSYGAPPSTFEPFLTIERKPTAALLVFGIHKRLSAQRILPELSA